MMTMTTTNAKYKPAHAGAKYDIQGFCLKHPMIRVCQPINIKKKLLSKSSNNSSGTDSTTTSSGEVDGVIECPLCAANSTLSAHAHVNATTARGASNASTRGSVENTSSRLDRAYDKHLRSKDRATANSATKRLTTTGSAAKTNHPEAKTRTNTTTRSRTNSTRTRTNSTSSSRDTRPSQNKSQQQDSNNRGSFSRGDTYEMPMKEPNYSRSRRKGVSRSRSRSPSSSGYHHQTSNENGHHASSSKSLNIPDRNSDDEHNTHVKKISDGSSGDELNNSSWEYLQHRNRMSRQKNKESGLIKHGRSISVPQRSGASSRSEPGGLDTSGGRKRGDSKGEDRAYSDSERARGRSRENSGTTSSATSRGRGALASAAAAVRSRSVSMSRVKSSYTPIRNRSQEKDERQQRGNTTTTSTDRRNRSSSRTSMGENTASAGNSNISSSRDRGRPQTRSRLTDKPSASRSRSASRSHGGGGSTQYSGNQSRSALSRDSRPSRDPSRESRMSKASEDTSRHMEDIERMCLALAPGDEKPLPNLSIVVPAHHATNLKEQEGHLHNQEEQSTAVVQKQPHQVPPGIVNSPCDRVASPKKNDFGLDDSDGNDIIPYPGETSVEGCSSDRSAASPNQSTLDAARKYPPPNRNTAKSSQSSAIVPLSRTRSRTRQQSPSSLSQSGCSDRQNSTKNLDRGNSGGLRRPASHGSQLRSKRGVPSPRSSSKRQINDIPTSSSSRAYSPITSSTLRSSAGSNASPPKLQEDWKVQQRSLVERGERRLERQLGLSSRRKELAAIRGRSVEDKDRQGERRHQRSDSNTSSRSLNITPSSSRNSGPRSSSRGDKKDSRGERRRHSFVSKTQQSRSLSKERRTAPLLGDPRNASKFSDGGITSAPTAPLSSRRKYDPLKKMYRNTHYLSHSDRAERVLRDETNGATTNDSASLVEDDQSFKLNIKQHYAFDEKVEYPRGLGPTRDGSFQQGSPSQQQLKSSSGRNVMSANTGSNNNHDLDLNQSKHSASMDSNKLHGSMPNLATKNIPHHKPVVRTRPKAATMSSSDVIEDESSLTA